MAADLISRIRSYSPFRDGGDKWNCLQQFSTAHRKIQGAACAMPERLEVVWLFNCQIASIPDADRIFDRIRSVQQIFYYWGMNRTSDIYFVPRSYLIRGVAIRWSSTCAYFDNGHSGPAELGNCIVTISTWYRANVDKASQRREPERQTKSGIPYGYSSPRKASVVTQLLWLGRPIPFTQQAVDKSLEYAWGKFMYGLQEVH